jgi:PAS domain S-box-containing protein
LDDLRSSEARLGILSEGIGEYAIFMLDAAGSVMGWNAGAQRLYGHQDHEVVGRTYARFFTPEDVAAGLPGRFLSEAASKGRLQEEVHQVKNDGARFRASVVATVLREGGRAGAYSVVARDLTEAKRVENQLRQQGDELRALARHLQSVREEERSRIARELHDELGQVLTALRMDLSILGHRVSRVVTKSQQGPLLEKLSATSRLVETTIKSVRRIVSELRPTVLDEFGLMTAIQWLAQDFESRSGIRCIVTKLQRDIDVKSHHATTLFRILQEALTNIGRHSGATKARISFVEENSSMILTIADNGKGFDHTRKPGRESFGLFGMQERARILGGRVDVLGEEGKGTTVTVHIPLDPVS